MLANKFAPIAINTRNEEYTLYFLSNIFLRTLSISKKIERTRIHNETLKKLPNYLMIAAVEGTVFEKIEAVKRWTKI